ncbi:hypothetical protein Q4493_10770 [Colwellia sp. 1_MG-2023]|uniref:hypothetical protein n=1 Tax=Colwellia sp. 1_MG-2023 TaxID=3062649 RepID=UPI0026E29976|nr:hypothetical protein [Colwellia sp. 1_MG-2023]MDO6446254.1 hypothetical protein [Colwellia sp. 1_MG-2023]
MIGIIALFFLVIIFVIVHSIANRFANDFSSENNPKLRKRLYKFAFSFCVLLLVGDEVVGGTQMAYFCLSEPKLEILVDDLKDRTVKGSSVRSHQEFTLIKIMKLITTVVDVNTGELITKTYWYKATGGWLSRTIAFNGSKKPILFNGECSNTKEFYQLRRQNNVKYLPQ